jgi:hypothetical protein
MISMTCDPRCETVRFVFAVFGLVQARNETIVELAAAKIAVPPKLADYCVAHCGLILASRRMIRKRRAGSPGLALNRVGL